MTVQFRPLSLSRLVFMC